MVSDTEFSLDSRSSLGSSSNLPNARLGSYFVGKERKSSNHQELEVMQRQLQGDDAFQFPS